MPGRATDPLSVMRDPAVTTTLPHLTRRRFIGACATLTSAGFLVACGDSEESGTSGADQVVGHQIPADDYEALFAQYQPAEEPEGDPDMVEWPDFVLSAPPEVQELYAFHVTNGWVMRYIPCFCGCNGSSGHQNNRDCYVQAVHADGSITFDPMAPT